MGRNALEVAAFKAGYGAGGQAGSGSARDGVQPDCIPHALEGGSESPCGLAARAAKSKFAAWQ